MGHDHGASPEPGWYPDPTATGHLRLWDGEGWTAQTRPFNPVPASAPSPDPAHTARRRRMAVEGAGLGLMLLVMAAGFPALPSWGSPARPAVRIPFPTSPTCGIIPPHRGIGIRFR